MNAEDILKICLEKPHSYVDYPFGAVPVCVKVEKRIFAQIYPDAKDCKITLNCDRMTGEFYRGVYPNAVVRGYHCPPVQQPYFNTIYLNGVVPDEEILAMIEHSYAVVVGKLPKYVRKLLAESES